MSFIDRGSPHMQRSHDHKAPAPVTVPAGGKPPPLGYWGNSAAVEEVLRGIDTSCSSASGLSALTWATGWPPTTLLRLLSDDTPATHTQRRHHLEGPACFPTAAGWSSSEDVLCSFLPRLRRSPVPKRAGHVSGLYPKMTEWDLLDVYWECS